MSEKYTFIMDGKYDSLNETVHIVHTVEEEDIRLVVEAFNDFLGTCSFQKRVAIVDSNPRKNYKFDAVDSVVNSWGKTKQLLQEQTADELRRRGECDCNCGCRPE